MNGNDNTRGTQGPRGETGRQGTSFRAFRNSPVSGRTSQWFSEFNYRSDSDIIDVVTYNGNAYIRVYGGKSQLPPDQDTYNWELFIAH